MPMSDPGYAFIDLDNTLLDAEKIIASARSNAEKLFLAKGTQVFDECYQQARGYLNGNRRANTPYYMNPLYVSQLFSQKTGIRSIKSIFKALFCNISFLDLQMEGATLLLQESKSCGFHTHILTLGNFFYQLSFIFYNPLLNNISRPETQGRVSGIGFLANYLG